MPQQIRTAITQINHHFTALLNRARWPQGWGRGRKLLAALVLALCLGAPAFAVVQSTFSDVPPSHPFYRAVEAIYHAGITAGCGTGLYCPDTAVTRGQMAAFLQRGLGRAYSNWERDIRLDQNTTVIGPAAQITVDTTDLAPGRTVFVKLDATVAARLVNFNPNQGYAFCGIRFYLSDLTNNGAGGVSTSGYFQLTSVGAISNAGALTWGVEVPTGAKTKFGLTVFFDGLTPPRQGQVLADTALTAITAPFGEVRPVTF